MSSYEGFRDAASKYHSFRNLEEEEVEATIEPSDLFVITSELARSLQKAPSLLFTTLRPKPYLSFRLPYLALHADPYHFSPLIHYNISSHPLSHTHSQHTTPPSFSIFQRIDLICLFRATRLSATPPCRSRIAASTPIASLTSSLRPCSALEFARVGVGQRGRRVG